MIALGILKTQNLTCPRSFVLASYCTGDLNASDAKDIRKHLAKCERCKKILEGMEKKRRDFLDKHPDDEMMPGWWRAGKS